MLVRFNPVTYSKKEAFRDFKCSHPIFVSLSFRSSNAECRGDLSLHEAPSVSPHGVPAALRTERATTPYGRTHRSYN